VAGRVFVTGGSGLIGRALVERLLRRGSAVVALARSDAAAGGLAGLGAEVVRGDLLDEESLAAGMRDCDVAFNVAGLNTLCPSDPAPLYRVNRDGARAVVRAAAAAGVRRVVHTSSAATLGEAEGTIGDEDSPHRGWFLSHYERSKTEGERAVLDEAARTGLDVLCVNPSSVQGPGRTGGTGRILLAMLDRRLPVFIDTRISVTDIGDAAEGHVLAAERGDPGRRYVLCGGTFTSAEAFALVSRVAGFEVRPRIVPGAVASAAGALVEAAARAVRRHPPFCRAMARTIRHGHAYDGTRAARELGLRYTPVEETLRQTLEWARAEGLVRAA
jgi:dihydroflavonol-4-reductase